MTRTLRILAVADPAVYVYEQKRKQIIDPFEKEHDVEVVLDIVAFEDYYDRLEQSFTEDADYDVVMIAGHLWLKEQVSNNRLLPFTEPPEKDLLPSVKKELYIGNTRYLSPSFCDGHMFVYRKDQISHAVGDVITIPEIVAIAKDSGIEKPGIVLKAAPSEIFLDVLPFMRHFGVRFFDENGLLDFRTPEAAEALELYCSLKPHAPEGTGTFGNEEVKYALQNNEVSCGVTWGGQLGFVMDEEMQNRDQIGFAVVQGAWNVTWSFGIHANTKQAYLAEAFLQHLSGPEIDRITGAFAGSPLLASTYEIDGATYSWYAAHRRLLTDIAEPFPVRADTGAIIAPLYKACSQAFHEDMPADKALEQAYREMVAVLGKEESS